MELCVIYYIRGATGSLIIPHYAPTPAFYYKFNHHNKNINVAVNILFMVLSVVISFPSIKFSSLDFPNKTIAE